MILFTGSTSTEVYFRNGTAIYFMTYLEEVRNDKLTFLKICSTCTQIYKKIFILLLTEHLLIATWNQHKKKKIVC